MKSIVIDPLKKERKGNRYIRRCILTRWDGNKKVRSDELFFSFPVTVNPPDDNDCDAYLLATVMDAMSENRTITVKGSVSAELLVNIREFQGCWKLWLPDEFNEIGIEADAIREGEKQNPHVMCAFSGGVDATFSVWRHNMKQPAEGAYQITHASFIHGLDIPLSEPAIFASACQSIEGTLQEAGIDLVCMATNYRQISQLRWIYAHGAAMVACLSNLKTLAGKCLIASSRSYNELIFPWGSNPVSDPLLSSAGFRIIHDGATHSRLDKIKAISGWQTATRNLRVCWENQDKEGNCGKCEKCLRTKIMFLLNHQPVPRCFPDWQEEIAVKDVTLATEHHRQDWKDLHRLARQNGFDKKTLSQIAQATRKKQPWKDLLMPRGTATRELAVKLKTYFLRKKSGLNGLQHT